jgi:hypothetical protein
MNKNIKIYYVKGCKVNIKTIFSGYIININDEPIIDSIKRKVQYKPLLCELTNEGFDYDLVNIYSIPLNELSLGDLLLILGKVDS